MSQTDTTIVTISLLNFATKLYVFYVRKISIFLSKFRVWKSDHLSCRSNLPAVFISNLWRIICLPTLPPYSAKFQYFPTCFLSTRDDICHRNSNAKYFNVGVAMEESIDEFFRMINKSNEFLLSSKFFFPGTHFA